MKHHTNDNRRSAERVRTYKRARIILNKGYSVFDCTIRNISATGAMLHMADQIGVPDTFELATGRARHGHVCTVRWRNEYALGVQFEDVQARAA